MKKLFFASAITFSLLACNNESDGTGANDTMNLKGNSDSASGGTITTAIDSSTSINQSTGTIHDSVGALKTDTIMRDSSPRKK